MSPTLKYQDTKLLLETAHFRDKLSLNSHFLLEKAHFRDKRVQYTMRIEQILNNTQPTDSQRINFHAFGILAERINHKALYISILRRTCIIGAGAD